MASSFERHLSNFGASGSAWIPNTDLSDLNPEECKEVSEKGKSKSLIQAYGVAAESHGLQHFKEMLQDHQRALQADLEEREEREAAKAAKAEKKKRKSEVAADDDVDMDDVEDGEEAPKPKSSKKRKKEEDSEGETEKVRYVSLEFSAPFSNVWLLTSEALAACQDSKN